MATWGSIARACALAGDPGRIEQENPPLLTFGRRLYSTKVVRFRMTAATASPSAAKGRLESEYDR